MPKVSVVMPVYNVQKFVAEAIESVLNQSYEDFELIIVDDCSQDKSLDICREFDDKRIKVVRHTVNRGLAAARNTGIRHAKADYIAFIDSDDMWREEKLQQHVTHLDNNSQVGVSFSRSEFMSPEGEPIDYYQMPRLKNITAEYLLCRNPVGNGSAPVVRREVFDEIKYYQQVDSDYESCWFDQNFRQSEDIECWVRISLTTQWRIEGLSDALTLYRLNEGGLSANLMKQLASWENMIEKIRNYSPAILHKYETRARAYQIRYLARQAIRLKDGVMAVELVNQALGTNIRILYEELGRTLATICAAYLMKLLPVHIYALFEKTGQNLIGSYQRLVILAKNKSMLASS